MKTTLLSLTALAALAVSAPLVRAADEEKKDKASETASEHKLADFKVGTHLSGPEVTDSSLEGKVVIMEFWGINCGPCLAAMPHLNDLDRKYGKKGLVIVGAHAQAGTDEEVIEKAKGLKVKFAITKGAHSPVQFSGIPKSFIFDATGALIWDGNPHDADFDKMVRKAMKTVTDKAEEKPATSSGLKPAASSSAAPLVASRTWTNTDGKTMEAALVSIAGTTGTFKGTNGKTFSYAIDKLSADDQKVIEEAQSASKKEE